MVSCSVALNCDLLVIGRQAMFSPNSFMLVSPWHTEASTNQQPAFSISGGLGLLLWCLTAQDTLKLSGLIRRLNITWL